MEYNVLNESWIPVRWRNGDQPSSVGLREAIVRAHEINELATDNPLETIALNRLLLALMASIHRDLREPENWLAVWDEGQFDPKRVDAYLNTYYDRFDLLSKTRPFYGHPDPGVEKVSSVTRLKHAATSGNNPMLFSHNWDAVAETMTLPEAARAVVCTQSIAVGGGKAEPFYLSDATLVGGAYFWLRGKVGDSVSLFNAIMLNLPPDSDNIWILSDEDCPDWEHAKPPEPLKRAPKGILDLLTLQSRRLKLIVNEDKKLTGVYYNQGSKVEGLSFDDPHLAYRIGKRGPYSLRFSVGKALWRDSTVFMATRDTSNKEGAHAPRTFEWLSNEGEDTLGASPQDPFFADVFGIINDQAKIENWRKERITLFPSIIEDADLFQTLEEVLSEANKENKRLQDAAKAFAKRVRLNKGIGDRISKEASGEVTNLVIMLGIENRYWPALNTPFEKLLARIAQAEDEENRERLTQYWRKHLRKVSTRILEEAIKSFAQDARSHQALAEAQIVLRGLPKKNKTEKST